ncbi:MAG: hypothetical protein JNJ50_11900 [Acidobacteria bacterium]|nr:hypothetical protein [Acidobacteriota bacterium]
MIPQLASPSVCVIDEDKEEYPQILNALLQLGLGCVHISGDSAENLPPEPFKGIRLVFTDLHLTSSVGKNAASHTANVFSKVVSKDIAPVIVVIWSKYAQKDEGSLPPDDEHADAELFKQTLLDAVPEYKNCLVFIEMQKPMPRDRSDNKVWVNELREKIETTLRDLEAFDVLWAWESLMRDIGIEVSKNLAGLVSLGGSAPPNLANLNTRLKSLLKHLAQRQAGPDCSDATALRHLLTVLSQLGQEHLETSHLNKTLGRHGNWLAEKLNDELVAISPSRLNSLILTTSAFPSFAPFPPGTIYRITDQELLMNAVGYSALDIQRDCFEGKNPEGSPHFKRFCEQTVPVFLEVSPACDFHQGNRRLAMLLAGVVCPAELKDKAKSKDAFKRTPVFENKYSLPAKDVVLVLCSNYRLTVNHDNHPDWLSPWIRLRDIFVTEIRNWHASQASRVGYLSF